MIEEPPLIVRTRGLVGTMDVFFLILFSERCESPVWPNLLAKGHNQPPPKPARRKPLAIYEMFLVNCQINSDR